jgi:hypothetical protein
MLSVGTNIVPRVVASMKSSWEPLVLKMPSLAAVPADKSVLVADVDVEAVRRISDSLPSNTRGPAAPDKPTSRLGRRAPSGEPTRRSGRSLLTGHKFWAVVRRSSHGTLRLWAPNPGVLWGLARIYTVVLGEVITFLRVSRANPNIEEDELLKHWSLDEDHTQAPARTRELEQRLADERKRHDALILDLREIAGQLSLTVSERRIPHW